MNKYESDIAAASYSKELEFQINRTLEELNKERGE